MLTPLEVLWAVASVVVAFLLVSDIRDECLRAMKPTLLRTLENAGVLTREDYLKRSGIDTTQLQAIEQAKRAASEFARGVVHHHHQNGHQTHVLPSTQNAATSPISPAASLAAPASGSPVMEQHDTPSTEKKRRTQAPQQPQQPSAQPAPVPSTASIVATSAFQSQVVASPETARAASEAVGHLSPETTTTQLIATIQEQFDTHLNGIEKPELARTSSRSSRKRSTTKTAQVAASPATTSSPRGGLDQLNIPSPSASPAPHQQSAATAVAAHPSITVPVTPITTTHSLQPSPLPKLPEPSPSAAMPTFHDPTDDAAGAAQHATTPVVNNTHLIQLQMQQQQQLHQQLQQQQQQRNSMLAANVAVPLAVPIIAGYPANQLTVVRSLDGASGEISVEEYFNAAGEKVAWRRGNIWDADFIYTLTQGLEFMKYSKWGSPHVRKLKFVLAAPEGSATNGSSNTSRTLRLDYGTGFLLLEDVTEVRAGKTTPVFQKYAKDPSAPDHACFSIITPKRTLDLSILVSKTQRIQEKRDLLVFGLGEVTGTRKSTAPPNAAATSTPATGVDAAAAAGEKRALLGFSPPPIPHQKIVEAILSQERSFGAYGAGGGGLPYPMHLPYGMGGGPLGPYGGGMRMGINSLQYPQREEYSLSTRQQQQSHLTAPGTPSATQYYRSQQSSPAVPINVGRSVGAPLGGGAARGSALYTMQQAQQPRHLLHYSSTPAGATGAASPMGHTSGVEVPTLPPPFGVPRSPQVNNHLAVPPLHQ